MMTSKRYADSSTRLPLTTLSVAVRVAVASSVHATPVRHTRNVDFLSHQSNYCFLELHSFGLLLSE